MANFTPGPWTLRRESGERVIEGADEALMGDQQYYPWVPSKDEDWYLITAAPEMYAALAAAEWGGNRGEKVCPVCRRLDFEEHRTDCLLANALAKADGEQAANG